MTNDRGAYMPEPRTRLALDRAIEAALRHGVVVYSVDVRGLQTGRMLASDTVVGNAAPASAEGDRKRFILDTQEGLTYIAEQTGGSPRSTRTTSARGHRARRQRHPQLLHPRLHADENTSRSPGRRRGSTRSPCKVKRPGLTVRTRKTFLGISDPPRRRRSRRWPRNFATRRCRRSRPATSRCAPPRCPGTGLTARSCAPCSRSTRARCRSRRAMTGARRRTSTSWAWPSIRTAPRSAT